MQKDLFGGAAGAAPVEASVRPPDIDAPRTDLRLGRWEEVLADVGEVDAVIVDAPYSARTHERQRHGRLSKREGYSNDACLTQRGLTYDALSDDDVHGFVRAWAPRTRGWFVTITDSELYPAWRDALRDAGRYVFAPLACVQTGMNVRLAGDGPSNWTVWVVVARPRCVPYSKWGTLPGAYVLRQDQERKRMGDAVVHGAKPLWLMQSLVRDYSRPGDLVCDPCAGGGTTLLAAAIEGRRAVGAEMDEKHFAIAQKRLSRGYTPTLFPEVG